MFKKKFYYLFLYFILNIILVSESKENGDVFDKFIAPQDMPRYNFARDKVSREFNLDDKNYVESLIVLSFPGILTALAVLIFGCFVLLLRSYVSCTKEPELPEGFDDVTTFDTNSMLEFEYKYPKSYKSPFCLRFVKFCVFLIIVATLAGAILGLTSNSLVSKEVDGFFTTIEKSTKEARDVVHFVKGGLAGSVDNVGSVLGNMTHLADEVNDAYQSARKARVSENNLNNLRQTIITMGYIIAILACGWGVFGVVNGKSWSFMFLSQMALLAICVSLLGLGLHLPLSAASDDLCISLGQYIKTQEPTPWLSNWLNCTSSEESNRAVEYAQQHVGDLLELINNYTQEYLQQTYTIDNIATLKIAQLRAALPIDVVPVFDSQFDKDSIKAITSLPKLKQISNCKYIYDSVKKIKNDYCVDIISNVNKIIFSEILIAVVWVPGFIFSLIYSKQKDDEINQPNNNNSNRSPPPSTQEMVDLSPNINN